MSIKTCFRNIFSASLENDGYIYNKKYGIFIKLVNGILLQYIACQNLRSYSKEKKEFTISGGILSVYTFSMEKKELLFYSGDIREYEREYLGKLIGFRNYVYNDDTMFAMLNCALNDTMKAILPVHDNVTDFVSYIEYRKHIRVDAIASAELLNECRNDALVLIKANNHDDFLLCFYRKLKNSQKELKKRRCSEKKKEYHDLFYDLLVVGVAQSRDKIYNDSILYSQAQSEIEKRKQTNLVTLKEIGII